MRLIDADALEPDADYDDVIYRQAAIDALNGIINRFEQILRDIRESKVDDSVCGMCEYDGAYIGQSGDWCNECPGFDKDDCFKLSDKCRKRWLESVDLPSAQSEPKTVRDILNSMTDDEFANWLCHQIFPDYHGDDEDDTINVLRYKSVINFLKRKETDEVG